MSKQTVPTPEVAAKYREVVRLRTLGVTFDDIAERVGYNSRGGAHDAYRAAIKWWASTPVDEARALEDERLEHLWRSVMARLQVAQNRPEPDTAEVVTVLNTAVNVMKRKASLLGLDAPRQVELAGVNGGPIATDVGELLRERIGLVRKGELPAAVEVSNNGVLNGDVNGLE
jgi:hypothetical protein